MSNKSQSRMIKAATIEKCTVKISAMAIDPIASSEKFICVNKRLNVAIIPPLPPTADIANCTAKNAIRNISAKEIFTPLNSAAKNTLMTIPTTSVVEHNVCESGM